MNLFLIQELAERTGTESSEMVMNPNTAVYVPAVGAGTKDGKDFRHGKDPCAALHLVVV